MAKYYGDIPCVRINNMVHITQNAISCLCGKEWSYGKPANRDSMQSNNIIWREIDAVTCDKCREVFRNTNNT